MQTTHAKFNQNDVDTRCKLCGEDEHFLLHCTKLKPVRSRDIPPLAEETARCGIDFYSVGEDVKVQLLLDCSKILQSEKVALVEKQSRRVCYSLHCRRMHLLEELARLPKSERSQNLSLMLSSKPHSQHVLNNEELQNLLRLAIPDCELIILKANLNIKDVDKIMLTNS